MLRHGHVANSHIECALRYHWHASDNGDCIEGFLEKPWANACSQRRKADALSARIRIRTGEQMRLNHLK